MHLATTFYNTKQEITENMAQWATRVRSLASHCSFPVVSWDWILKYKFIIRILPGLIHDRLMEKSIDITLKKAIGIAASKMVADGGI